MKSTTFIQGLAFATGLFSILFKTMHWPGANMLIMLTLIMLIALTILVIKANRENGLTDWMNYLLTVFLLIIITGTGFVFFNYPGAGILTRLSQIAIVMLPGLILLFNKDNKVSNAFWVPFLICMMLVLMNMPKRTVITQEATSSMEVTE